jgi:hypothetical protein
MRSGLVHDGKRLADPYDAVTRAQKEREDSRVTRPHPHILLRTETRRTAFFMRRVARARPFLGQVASLDLVYEIPPLLRSENELRTLRVFRKKGAPGGAAAAGNPWLSAPP